MPVNKGLLGVRHGRKYQEADSHWVLTTKRGVFIKAFSTEADLDSWWQTFQMTQGRKPLPQSEGVAPEREKKRRVKAGAPSKVTEQLKKKRRISEQLNQIMERGVITPPHSSGTGGEDFLKPWSEKYDMPEYDLE